MQPNRMRTWIVVAVIVLMVGAALYQNIVTANERASGTIEEAAKPGFRAPSFELEGLDGKVYRVGGERSNPLLLNFWASWCGPCHMEAADLEKLYEQYNGKLDVYGINVTSLDSESHAQRFVDDYRLTFPIPLDLDGNVTSSKYRVSGYPTSFLIDQNGVIVDAVFGIINPKQLEKRIDSLLQTY